MVNSFQSYTNVQTSILELPSFLTLLTSCHYGEDHLFISGWVKRKFREDNNVCSIKKLFYFQLGIPFLACHKILGGWGKTQQV